MTIETVLLLFYLALEILAVTVLALLVLPVVAAIEALLALLVRWAEAKYTVRPKSQRVTLAIEERGRRT